MITSNVYEQLKEKYGDVSSWALWAEQTPGKPKSNIEDMSVFYNPDLMTKLTTEYIFVGLNAAEHDIEYDDPWRPFHSGDTKRQQDYKIRYTLLNTPLWGAYITDVIKGYPKTDSSRVMKDYWANESLRKKTKKDFKEELEIIGGKPTLIAFGNNTYQILMDMKDELNVDKIIVVQHYSAIGKYAWGNKENYRKNFWEALENQGLSV